MTTAITNPVELRSRGFQALVKELGWVNAVRFLREYEELEPDEAPAGTRRRRLSASADPPSAELDR
jgi:hypothetical protein